MKRGHPYWIGRFAVEAAVALTALESGDEDLARIGLSETIDEFLATDADADLAAYVNEMRRESRALTPVDIPFRGDTEITGYEIADKI